MVDWILCILAVVVEDKPSIFVIMWNAKVVSNHTVSIAKYGMNKIIVVKTHTMKTPHCAAGVLSNIKSDAHTVLQRCFQKNLLKSHSTLHLFPAWKYLSSLDNGLAATF